VLAVAEAQGQRAVEIYGKSHLYEALFPLAHKESSQWLTQLWADERLRK
jgi:hypothetical protein